MKLDPIHIRFAYSLAGATQLPLTGDKHPLSKEATRWTFWSASLALLFGFSLFVGWQRLESRAQDLASARPVFTVPYREIGPPPSIARSPKAPINVAPAVHWPEIAVPEPVLDELAPEVTFLTRDQIDATLRDMTNADLEPGMIIGPDVPGPAAPPPEVHEAQGPVNELPVRLSMDRPQYPEMARMAQIEGTVVLNVHIGTNGHVLAVEVESGPAQLRQAAIKAAKTALFLPATMDGRPVAVWVTMPIKFRLSSCGE